MRYLNAGESHGKALVSIIEGLPSNLNIDVNFINTIVEYLKVYDYAILYVVLILMSLLISMKYSKKLFKNTVMNTLKEEA